MRLALDFSDGASGVVDFKPVFEGRPGSLGELMEPEAFAQVYLDEGILTWPNGVGLDPLVVYCRATGRKLTEFVPEADDSILKPHEVST